MLGTVVNIFRIPDLRNKVVFTVAMLMIYRVGYHIPIPCFDQRKIEAAIAPAGGESPMGRAVELLQMFSGGKVGQEQFVWSWNHALYYGIDYSYAFG